MSVVDQKYAEAIMAGRKLQNRWIITKIIGTNEEDVSIAVARGEDDAKNIKIVRHRKKQNLKIGDRVDIFECPQDITFLAAIKEDNKNFPSK